MSEDRSRATSKEYIRPMPAAWWLKRRTYFLFMVRELTCVFVGGYALFLLVLATRRDDQQAFEALLLDSPVLWALQIIALPMVLYHSITWLNLTPKVMVLWRGEERVSPTLIAGANHAAWAIVSIIILFIASRYN